MTFISLQNCTDSLMDSQGLNQFTIYICEEANVTNLNIMMIFVVNQTGRAQSSPSTIQTEVVAFTLIGITMN